MSGGKRMILQVTKYTGVPRQIGYSQKARKSLL